MRDTSIIVRTFEKFDSVYITNPNDTIIVDNEKVWTRIIRSWDTIRVEQQVSPDTIIQIRDQVRIKYRTKTNNWPLLLIPLIIMLLWKRHRTVR